MPQLARVQALSHSMEFPSELDPTQHTDPWQASLDPHLRSLVGQQGVLRGVLSVRAGLELGEVAVVVTLHLQVKHLRQNRHQ